MFQSFIPKKPGHKLLIYDILFLLVGIAVGITGRNVGISNEVVMMVAFPGEIYMRLIHMIPVILVISAIISGTWSHQLHHNAVSRTTGLWPCGCTPH